jgi:hypothetical protein
VRSAETNSAEAADALVVQFQQLRAALHAMTSVSVQAARTYKLAVDNACAGTDAAILALHTLAEKCRTLLHELRTMAEIADQIRTLREAVLLLEATVSKATK